MARIALIDPGGRMAGTIRAVLGAQHEISVSARMHAPGDADLVIVDVPRLSAADQPGLRSLRSFGPVLVLIDRRSPVPAFLSEGRGLRLLRKPFEAFELRLTVDRLLEGRSLRQAPAAAAGESEEERSWLEFPFVPAPASAVLQRAARLSAPLWIFGEPGCGRRRVARAICRARLARVAPLVLLPADSFDDAVQRASQTEDATLMVYHVEHRPLAEQERLATLLEMQPPFRLIAISTDDPAEAVVDKRFSSDLYRHLIGLAVQLSPLRERPIAIPPLVQILARRLLRQLGSEVEVSFTPDAMGALQTYLWPGNLVELEAVLLRTLITLDEESLAARPIDADQILFTVDPHPAALPASEEDSALLRLPGGDERRQRPSEDDAGDERAGHEALMAGLAHELRNPMAVIKTFAERRSSDDNSGDNESRRLAELADEACGRIEGYLEEMEAYGALAAPRREPVALGELIAGVAAETRGLSGERLRIEGVGGKRARADGAHLRFVLENLLAAAAGETGDDGSIFVRLEDERCLLIEVERPRGPIAQLRRITQDTGPVSSWRLLLARTVAARNGWKLDVEMSEEAMRMRCLLALEEVGSREQQSNRSDR